MSIFAFNIATVLGLGLAVDYGLFIVSRFRDELAAGRVVSEALDRTVSTAGRTVGFSAVTVVIAFVWLLVFPQPYVRSIGLGGISVVLFDMIAALTVLPALLAAARLGELESWLGTRKPANVATPCAVPLSVEFQTPSASYPA